jgi:dienelactone hydrolase
MVLYESHTIKVSSKESGQEARADRARAEGDLRLWRYLPAAAADRLGLVVEAIRARPEVDADRMALWAFSGGGMLVGRWLADSPAWLGCVALSYPLLRTLQPPAASSSPCDVLRPGRPIALTRVGRERPEVQATVDAFLARAAVVNAAVEVIDVPDGQHGFDVLDHAPWSREAVTAAMTAVHRHLLGGGHG